MKLKEASPYCLHFGKSGKCHQLSVCKGKVQMSSLTAQHHQLQAGGHQLLEAGAPLPEGRACADHGVWTYSRGR